MSFPINYELLRGRHLYFEQLSEAHIPALRELAHDARIWEYTRTLLVNDSFNEQFDRYIQQALDPAFGGLQHSFVMRDAQTDRIMGSTRFYKIDPTHKRLSIGYTWYLPDYWGRVHNKEGKLMLMKYAFETLGFQRVEFEVAHQNIRSQKAVARIGAQLEGRLRKHGLHADGTVRDTFVFSITDEEWPEKKAALEYLVKAGEIIS